MTFSSLMYKNLRYNFKRYISYFLVNSIIVSILFMYGSVMFNDILIREVGHSSIYKVMRVFSMGFLTSVKPLEHSPIYKIMKIAFGCIVFFSILFMSFTNISFIKYRKKELGIFLTLGMTTRDLIKMNMLENAAVVLSSLITGVITGVVFSNLFYLGLKKVLMLESIIYKVSYKTFIVSIGVSLIIFLLNAIFSGIYIYKLSIIIDVKRPESKKEAGKPGIALGIFALVILIGSAYFIPEIMKNDWNILLFFFFIGATLISPYLLIISFMRVFMNISNKIPDLYNNNLLVLSNLVRRFSTYKIILYIVSLSIAGSIFGIGFSYSLYSSVEEQTNENCPYDIMFAEADKYNHVLQEKVNEIIKSQGGIIETYNVLECIELPNYRRIDDKIEYCNSDGIVISESNYNKNMDLNLEIKTGEMIIIKENGEKYYGDSDNIFTLDGEEKVQERRNLFDKNNYAIPEVFFNTVRKEDLFIIPKEKVKYLSKPIVSSASRFIVNDTDYQRIKSKVGGNATLKVHQINLDKRNDKKTFYGLLDYLKKINGGDEDVWDIKKYTYFKENAQIPIIETYRPLFKQEEFEVNIRQKGFFFFTCLFSGIMFLIFSCVVLYYKILTNVEEEKERISSISKIGMTEREVTKVLLKELKIIYIVPIILGGGLALYYLSVMYSITSLFDLLMKKSITILMVYVVLQILFYFVSKRRYLNEVLK